MYISPFFVDTTNRLIYKLNYDLQIKRKKKKERLIYLGNIFGERNRFVDQNESVVQRENKALGSFYRKKEQSRFSRVSGETKTRGQ